MINKIDKNSTRWTKKREKIQNTKIRNESGMDIDIIILSEVRKRKTNTV